MMRVGHALFAVLAVSAVWTSFGTSQANALVTQSSILSPATPQIVDFDGNTGTGNINVLGSAAGAADGDKVDVACIDGAEFKIVSQGVVIADEQFSTGTPNLGNAAGMTCRLAAVPFDEIPADMTPFTGPLVTIRVQTGFLESGKLFDYNYIAGQFPNAMVFRSAGSQAATASFLYDAATNELATQGLNGNAFIPAKTFDDSDTALKVDGASAYLPSAAVGLASLSGFPILSYSTSYEPESGNTVIDESDQIVSCLGSPLVPNLANCPLPTLVGVKLERQISQQDNGSSALITDKWTSIDGSPHTISLRYRHSFCLGNPSCNNYFRFAFSTGYQIISPTPGAVVSGPFPQNGFVDVADPFAADGDQSLGRASVTTSKGADDAVFVDAATYDMRYKDRLIPASGSLVIQQLLANAFSSMELSVLKATGLNRFTIDTAPVEESPASGPPALERVAKAKLIKRGSRLRISSGYRVLCPAVGTSCVGSIKLSLKSRSANGKRNAARFIPLGTIALDLSSIKTQQLSLTLSKKSTRLLQRHKRVEISLVPDVSNSAGRLATSRMLRLTVPPARGR